MKLKIEAVSDVGVVRSNNEDIAIVGEKKIRDKALSCECRTPLLIAVADGMGGYEGGEIASELVADQLIDFCDEADFSADSFKVWASVTNDVVLARAKSLGFNDMGTTLTGIHFGEDGNALMFNIGDSRVYRLRDGILRQLTTDHSMKELTKNPDYPSNIIYNCFGLERDFFADVKDVTDMLLPDDTVLVCSDGLSDMLPDDEIESLLPSGAEALLSAANNAGGEDNITFIIATLLDDNN
ncbi:MAG: protein phosphatase 2C domain-containing protein [Paramuribaculum sp.]|nr:protein phosphatase 2C domain-containing protein [Paramuribaculum sp.]